jgi:drug/metabolite transporter (DMT)-like permease
MTKNNLLGVGFLVLALLDFSLQDVAIKWIGGHYPVLELLLFRSVVAMPFTLLLFRLEGRRGLPSTAQPGLEYWRGFFLFVSYTTYVMGLMALPLSDVAAIRNSAPLMLTLFSVVWLGERVGLRNWLALIVGFVGVLLIVKPGSVHFDIGSVFVLLSTLFYALAVMLTRQLRADSSATMAYYSSLVYLLATCVLAPLSLLVGEIPNAHPSIAFVFRAWIMPSPLDALVMGGLGFVWATGMYLVARAYSLAQASVVAPFEYSSLPINVIWGFALWRQLPTLTTWVGALLTLSSGLYILSQQRKETVQNKT